jgi:chorismate mutase / prephenate dehydratase
LRPGREAFVMRRRLAAHEGGFPATAVFRIWREMMSAFTLMQTPGLKIAICRPVDQPGYWDLARDHFGCQIPLVAHDTPTQVVAAVRNSTTTLGVVPAPIETDVAPWFPLLAAGDPTLPNVVARLPFLTMPNARARGISALVLAPLQPEQSGDDRSLLAIESVAGLSRNRISSALVTVGLPPFSSALDHVAGGVHHYLIEIAGMVVDGDPRLAKLETALELGNGHVATIGAYAVPVPARP